jgi:hypothetical protein
LEAEIDFSGIRVGMIGADLAWFPASHGHVSLPEITEDFFNMVFRFERLFYQQVENVHTSLHPLANYKMTIYSF